MTKPSNRPEPKARDPHGPEPARPRPKKAKARPSRERPLTPKQARFVDEYMVDLNATKAATRAGYSAKTAYSIGSELLTKLEIADAIKARQAELSQATGITAERVLKELERIGFSDPRKVMTWGTTGVKLKSSDELTDDEAAIIAGIKESTGNTNTLELKLHDKVGALTKLGDHLGLWKHDPEASGKTGGKGSSGPGQSATTGVLLVPGVMSVEDWIKLTQSTKANVKKPAKD